jgi:hypothetical protein
MKGNCKCNTWQFEPNWKRWYHLLGSLDQPWRAHFSAYLHRPATNTREPISTNINHRTTHSRTLCRGANRSKVKQDFFLLALRAFFSVAAADAARAARDPSARARWSSPKGTSVSACSNSRSRSSSLSLSDSDPDEEETSCAEAGRPIWQYRAGVTPKSGDGDRAEGRPGRVKEERLRLGDRRPGRRRLTPGRTAGERGRMAASERRATARR